MTRETAEQRRQRTAPGRQTFRDSFASPEAYSDYMARQALKARISRTRKRLERRAAEDLAARLAMQADCPHLYDDPISGECRYCGLPAGEVAA